MGAGAGTAVDEAFVLERRERLTNGVAGDEELACQVLLARQAVGVAAAWIWCLSTSATRRAWSARGRRIGVGSACRSGLIWLATVTSRGLFVV